MTKYQQQPGRKNFENITQQKAYTRKVGVTLFTDYICACVYIYLIKTLALKKIAATKHLSA